MSSKNLRVLIASAPKTGNTWLKVILSSLFDLPVAYLDMKFSPAQADSLGSRWVAHQHYLPTPKLLEWAARNNVRIVTTLRHPADLLVSYYHHVRNYPQIFEGQRRIFDALQADAAPQNSDAGENSVVEGELIEALLNRLIADLSISISWVVNRCDPVRYEDLSRDPRTTIAQIAPRIAEVSQDSIDRAVANCDIATLRRNAGADAKFYRKGNPGEWRRALPPKIARQLSEEPYRSQIAFLGYTIDDVGATLSQTTRSGRDARRPRFQNGVCISPFLRDVFHAVSSDKNHRWPSLELTGEGSFFEWLNLSADDDAEAGGIPLITNLALVIYRARPDLQSVFPDVFRSGRIGFVDWFMRYGSEEYALDRAFLVPVATSWLKPATERSQSIKSSRASSAPLR